jgi:hypothetical protein
MMRSPKLKIELNSRENLSDILNELYNETVMLILTVQDEMNSLSNSTGLDSLDMDDKANYARSMHQYICDKTAALKLKMDISKLLAEVLKTGGNEKAALQGLSQSGEKIESFDLKSLQKALKETADTADVKNYTIRP